MQHTIENIENSQVKVTITLSKEEWREEIVNAYNKTKGKYSIQGFRKGKVPMKIIEANYGEGVFYDEAINSAFIKHYYDILDANTSLNVIGRPELDIQSISADGLTFVAIAPVKPEFEVGNYKGIDFKKNVYTVTDAEIDVEVKKLQENGSRLIDVADRVAKTGDTANINFEGFLDDVAFAGGKAEGFDLELGSNSFIPGFEDGVVGMAIGEDKDINVTFPEQYQEQSLAGKPVVFKVKLNSLKVKELPILDDEFAKDVSEFDTLAALRADFKAKLDKKNQDKADYELESSIIDAICDATTVEIPEAMVETQIDSMEKDFEYRLMYQGLKLEDYLKYSNTTKEDFRKQFVDEAKKSVKAQLVIDKIITAESLKATAEEIEAKVAEQAATANKPVDEFKASMKPEQMEYIARNIVIDKLFVFLKKENKIN